MKSKMKTIAALLKLEYWEHRGAFVKTPLIIGLVMGVITILAYATSDRFVVDLRANTRVIGSNLARPRIISTLDAHSCHFRIIVSD